MIIAEAQHLGGTFSSVARRSYHPVVDINIDERNSWFRLESIEYQFM